MSALPDDEARQLMTEGFELLCSQARTIAMLPLEDWLEAMKLAEITAPFVDPTLYREYLNSPKVKVIKELIAAAIPLKRIILDAQDLVKGSGE